MRDNFDFLLFICVKIGMSINSHVSDEDFSYSQSFMLQKY